MRVHTLALHLTLLAASLFFARSDCDAQDRASRAAEQPVRWPGMQSSGQMLLPTQWSLKPAGKQLLLGDFPVTIAMHPKLEFAAILHAGYGEHEIIIVNTQEFRVVSKASVPETFVGLCFDSQGNELFVSGAEKEVIYQFHFDQGFLSNQRTHQLVDVKEKQVPAGLALSADDQTLYVACPWGQSVCVWPLAQSDKKKFITCQADDYPYYALPDRDGKRLYVSLWGHAAVAVINLQSFKEEARWPTQSHPTELLLTKDQKTLYVACANSNNVTVIDTDSGKTLEVITSSLYPKDAPGSTPNSVSLSSDEKVLLIANATNNNVALIDVHERGKSRSLGFVPTGWYPTSARFSPHDGKIYVANGKGLTPKANRQGPNPINNPPKTTQEYIAGLFQGTLSQIDPPSPQEMSRFTKSAFACSPLREDKAPVSLPVDPRNPVPTKVGEPSLIKYCIYIIKENRTYDQVFGDLPQGNGDPALCIFPRNVTPNHHALAEEYVLLDNFYVESEVSADGHEWSMAAYATDFVEKSWPLMYRGSREGKLKYPAEGSFEIAHPSSGYLWDRAAADGVTYRSYGEFIANPAKPGEKATAKVKALEGHFDPDFHGYDLDYRDVDRAARFISEVKRFEQAGDMPRLQIVRLPNDHTSGTAVGKKTPTAMVADNDLALGQIIEALSQSRFWKETAVFVVEDDAQNGSDHVDAHRTVALVISPHCKRGYVDSHMYSTSSMLRTMELILGMQPMTQFDAAALPMYDSFTSTPSLKPYLHRPAQVDLNAVNRPDAYGAKLSATFDLSREDAADDLLLNEVIWRSVRGADNPMPAPVRAGFVFAGVESDDDEEEEEEEEEEEKRKQEEQRARSRGKSTQ